MTIPKGEKIRCRSKKHPECYDGKPSAQVYPDDGPGMSEDGTFDGQTIVCDACYIGIGMPGIDVAHPDAPGFGASIDQGDPR